MNFLENKYVTPTKLENLATKYMKVTQKDRYLTSTEFIQNKYFKQKTNSDKDYNDSVFMELTKNQQNPIGIICL